MKKILIATIMIVSVIMLSACQSTTLSLKEVQKIPKDIQNSIDVTQKLQSFIDGEKGSYIIYRTVGKVSATVEENGDTVIVNLDVDESDDDVVNQHVFYLTIEPKHETIDVLENGESIPFDQVNL